MPTSETTPGERVSASTFEQVSEPAWVGACIDLAREFSDRSYLRVIDRTGQWSRCLYIDGLYQNQPRLNLVTGNVPYRALVNINVNGIENIEPARMSVPFDLQPGLSQERIQLIRARTPADVEELLKAVKFVESDSTEWRLIRHFDYNNEYHIRRWNGQWPWLTDNEALVVLTGSQIQRVSPVEEYL